MQLGHSLSAGGLDARQRLLGLVGLASEDPAGGAGLDAPDADVVGHHVVELPGDPHPLVEDGSSRSFLPLVLQLRGPLLQRHLVLAAAGHGVAERQRGSDEDEVEQDDEQVPAQQGAGQQRAFDGEEAVGEKPKAATTFRPRTQSRLRRAP